MTVTIPARYAPHVRNILISRAHTAAEDLAKVYECALDADAPQTAPELLAYQRAAEAQRDVANAHADLAHWEALIGRTGWTSTTDIELATDEAVLQSLATSLTESGAEMIGNTSNDAPPERQAECLRWWRDEMDAGLYLADHLASGGAEAVPA